MHQNLLHVQIFLDSPSLFPVLRFTRRHIVRDLMHFSKEQEEFGYSKVR